VAATGGRVPQSTTDAAHTYVDELARLLEFSRVAIIIGGLFVASFLFARSGRATGDWRSAYELYRSNRRRGILLGLELFVGANACQNPN
jgi:hypothetical protein